MSKKFPERMSEYYSELAKELGPSIESQIAWYHHMQQTQPVRYRPEYDLWEVFCYQDVKHVLLEDDTFSFEDAIPETFPTVLKRYNAALHRQLRGLQSKTFARHSVEELTPRLIQMVDELLEPALASGKMNVVTAFNYPLPIHIIAEVLGLPPQDQGRFQRWASQLFAQCFGIPSPDDDELLRYFSDLLNERERNPRNDLISVLLVAQEDGAPLMHEDVITMCLHLVVAGTVSSTRMFNNAIHHLCVYPEIYQALRTDPSLIPGMIEETLRYYSSLSNPVRAALHDTVLGEHEIKAGQYVMPWVRAANFDETSFPHSEQFDIRRSPNLHMTFSHGVHVCLGRHLACLDGRIALERIVTHFSDIRLDPEKPVQFVSQMGWIEAMQSLDVLFTRSLSSQPVAFNDKVPNRERR